MHEDREETRATLTVLQTEFELLVIQSFDVVLQVLVDHEMNETLQNHPCSSPMCASKWTEKKHREQLVTLSSFGYSFNKVD